MRMKIIGHYIKSSGAFIFILVIAALSGAIAGELPLIDDDLAFITSTGCFLHTPCPDNHYSFLESVIQHHNQVNGRFFDMFSVMFARVPRIWFGVLFASVYFAVMLIMMRLASLKLRENGFQCVWLAVATLMLFPWIDMFYTRSLFLNYMMTLFFGMVSVYGFTKKDNAKGWHILLYLVCAFLAGGGHEEMPFILLPSGILYCCMTRKVTLNQVIIAAGLLLGTLFILSSPSVFNRTSFVFAGFVFFPGKLQSLLYSGLIFLIGLTAVAMVCRRKDSAPKERKALVMALALTVVPSFLLTAGYLFSLRICFFAMAFNITAFFIALPKKRLLSSYKATAIVLTLFAGAFSIFQLVLTLVETVKARRYMDEICRQLASDPWKPAYFDMDLLRSSRQLTLCKSIGSALVGYCYTYENLMPYVRHENYYDILSPELRDFDVAKADTLDADKGEYFYRNCVVIDAPCDSMNCLLGSMTLRFADGSREDFEFNGPFFRDVNGKELIYLYPVKPMMPKKRVEAIESLNYELHWR